MPLEFLSSLNLPGWEAVLFIILVLAFLITGAIVTIVILSRLRWPFHIVIITNEAGKGYGVSGRDKGRIIAFGDGGEELILLKRRRKKRVGYGKRTGHKQISFVIGEDGLWYQAGFGDFDKTLRELGLVPTSVNVRMAMASARKGLDDRLQPKSWLEKYLAPLMFGMFILALLINAFVIIKASNNQISVAQINAQSINASKEVQQSTKQTIDALTILVNKLNQAPAFSGSGLISS